MTKPPSFESSEALHAFIIDSPLESFQHTTLYLSPFEFAQAFFWLQTEPSQETKEKLMHLFHLLDSPTKLENFGKSLTPAFFQALLDYIGHHVSYENRLPFILVGFQPHVFSETLGHLTEKHLVLLKHESLLEPLQYHLTQFIHEGERLLQTIEKQIQQLIINFQSIEHEELTQDRLSALYHSIDEQRDVLLEYLERTKQALALVWQTNRIDLIDKLSSLQEGLHHQLTHAIGTQPTKGLYLLLEQILSSIFDMSLTNQDAALEGLTRLSIWHLKDYKELGLLPPSQQIQDLHYHTQADHWTRHQSLFAFVQKQLERLKIGTVGELKKACIFSRSLLKDYLKQHQDLLDHSIE